MDKPKSMKRIINKWANNLERYHVVDNRDEEKLEKLLQSAGYIHKSHFKILDIEAVVEIIRQQAFKVDEYGVIRTKLVKEHAEDSAKSLCSQFASPRLDEELEQERYNYQMKIEELEQKISELEKRPNYIPAGSDPFPDAA